MAATVIDSLLVTLGLDPSGYRKGAAEAEASQKKFRESTKKTGDEIGAALKNIGKEVAGLFIAFEGVKGTLNFFGGLNTELANLGRFSRNIGMSAHEVNGWGQAVELAGGKAEEAQSDLAKLQNDIVAFNTKGEISPLLLLFQRTGVAVQDAQGKTRKLTDIYKDLGDVLRRTDQATAHAWAQQAGLSDSTFNLISMEARARQDLIDKAEANNKVTDESVKKAAEIQAKWRDIGQAIKGAAVAIYEFFEPAVSQVLTIGRVLWGFFTDLFALMVKGWKMIGEAIMSIPGISSLVAFMAKWGGKAVEGIAGAASAMRSAVHEAAGTATPPSVATAPPAGAGAVAGSVGARNNNPGNLRYAHQKNAIGSDERGFAIFRTWQDGVDAARSQIALDASRGQNTVSSIIKSWAPPGENNTEAYIADVSRRLGVNRDQALNPQQFAALANAIFVHEGSMRAGAFANSAAAGVGAPAVARVAGASHETNVEVGQVVVHTQATDAEGMASGAAGALKRKIGTAQLNSGMS